MITQFLEETSSSLREIFLSTPKFVQFLFSIRHIWWGTGAFFFNFHFTLNYLDYLSQFPYSFCSLVFGFIGLIGVVRGKYMLEMAFAIFNLLLFSLIALTFLRYDPRSMSSINYFVEMLGSIWLVFRIQHNHAKAKRLQEFLG